MLKRRQPNGHPSSSAHTVIKMTPTPLLTIGHREDREEYLPALLPFTQCVVWTSVALVLAALFAGAVLGTLAWRRTFILAEKDMRLMDKDMLLMDQDSLVGDQIANLTAKDMLLMDQIAALQLKDMIIMNQTQALMDFDIETALELMIKMQNISDLADDIFDLQQKDMLLMMQIAALEAKDMLLMMQIAELQLNITTLSSLISMLQSDLLILDAAAIKTINNGAVLPIGGDVDILGGTAISVVNGAGSVTINNLGVTSLNTLTGPLTISAAAPPAVGTTTGLRYTSVGFGITVENTGMVTINSVVAAFGNFNILAGTAIGVTTGIASATINNLGVTSITAGTAISVTPGPTGAVTVSNTGVTSAIGGTGISISGGPTGMITISSTVNTGITTIVPEGSAGQTGPTITFKDIGGISWDSVVANEIRAIWNGVTIKDEGGVILGNPFPLINFVGNGVSALDGGGGCVTVTIPGGAGGGAVDTVTGAGGGTGVKNVGLSTAADIVLNDFSGARGISAVNPSGTTFGAALKGFDRVGQFGLFGVGNLVDLTTNAFITSGVSNPGPGTTALGWSIPHAGTFAITVRIGIMFSTGVIERIMTLGYCWSAVPPACSSGFIFIQTDMWAHLAAGVTGLLDYSISGTFFLEGGVDAPVGQTLIPLFFQDDLNGAIGLGFASLISEVSIMILHEP